MGEDVTDFAALISEYEATEHDMLNNLDAASTATDGTPAKGNGNETPLPLLASNPRRNAPSFSDSDDSDDDSDDDNDETSYTAEEDHASGNDEPFAYESDTNGAEETSYTEGNDDQSASESDDDGSQSEEYESDSDEEDQSSQPSYTEEGTSEHSENDYQSQERSPSYSGSRNSSSSRSMDPDGINATSAFDELAPMLKERRNAPISDSDDSDTENQDAKASHIISPVPSTSIKRRNAPVMDSDSDSESDSGSESDNASYEEDSQQGSVQSEYESDQEGIREGGNNANQKPESTRSYDSYETDDSEGNDDNDEASASFYESGDESSDGSGSNDSDSSYSEDSNNDNSNNENKSTFNQRGGSKHGFQHPTIESNDDSSSSDSSSSSSSSDSENRWDDAGAMSHSESANDELFENEPEKASILGADDNIEIESDRSESEFEDEPPSKRKTKNKSKNVKKGKNKKTNTSDSDSSSDSDSDSDSSESEFDDEDHSINVYDGEEGRSIASSKQKKRGRTNLSSTERSGEREHILSREKLVNERENTVNTRERKFTKWFIIAAGIVLLGAIILVSVYFSRRGKTAAPTPSTVVITLPTEMPVAIPIGVPAPPTTDAPTPLPANKVIVETSFLAFVRDGKTSGVTTEGLESELKIILPIFLPGLLEDVVDDGVLTARARRFLRRLQNEKLAIDDPVDVDVIEIDCPQGSSDTDLCVQVTTNVPIINSSADFTEEFASGLQTAFSDTLIERIDGGVLESIGSSVQIGVYEEGEALPTMAPTVAPKDTTAPTAAPTETPTVKETQLRGSSSPTPATNSTSNSTTAPSPTEVQVTGVPTLFGTVNPDGSQAPSPAPVSNNATITSSPTVAPTVTPVCEDRNEACQEVSESGNCTQTKCAFWASEGECASNPNYMNVNCEQSCGLCGDEGGPPEPECLDENEKCSEWAVQGECTANEAYMSLNCKDSCGYCRCEDKNGDCAELLSSANVCIQSKCELWKSQDECENNAEYMDIFCRKSCESCVDTSCIDEDSRCGGWAATGECDTNPEYMNRNCKKSCAKCS